MPQLSTIDKVFQRSTIPLTLSHGRDASRLLHGANDALRAMTGYAASECTGRDCRFLQGEDRARPVRHELREVLRDRIDTEVVLRNCTRGGKMFDTLLFVPVREREGAEALNRHLKELDTGPADIAASRHVSESRVKESRVKRRLSATLRRMPRSATLQERLARRAGR